MPTPHELLAKSLDVLRALALEKTAIKSSEISRTHRERLLKHGFLKEVTKGWYVSSNPDERPGDTTSWYMAYWKFCSEYLEDKYGDEYCLSAEQSLLMHAGNTMIPQQLIVRSPVGSNKMIDLLNNTSLYLLKSSVLNEPEIVDKDGLKILSLPSALIDISPYMYQKSSKEVRIALAQIDDPSELLRILLEGSHTKIAGRIAGAFRNIGQDRNADRIINTMTSAGFNIREEDPFQEPSPFKLSVQVKSPFVTRIELMWEEMRNHVIKQFPDPPGLPDDPREYLKAVDEIYVTDAYHSLSIERYVVSAELIESVRSGEWNTNDEAEKKHRDAMAARGYWQASQKVKNSIRKILAGDNAGSIADFDHSGWFIELFAPSVTAGIIKPSDLAGYRINQVYISNSLHIPPDKNSVRDTMPEFFELLKNETNPGVRAVLGHFIFVFIHPYMDGNGRMGRFLMNVMLASGGYPWTVIPVQERSRYMQALEKASVEGDIEPFARFIAYLVTESLKGTPVAQLSNSPVNS